MTNWELSIKMVIPSKFKFRVSCDEHDFEYEASLERCRYTVTWKEGDSVRVMTYPTRMVEIFIERGSWIVDE